MAEIPVSAPAPRIGKPASTFFRICFRISCTRQLVHNQFAKDSGVSHSPRPRVIPRTPDALWPEEERGPPPGQATRGRHSSPAGDSPDRVLACVSRIVEKSPVRGGRPPSPCGHELSYAELARNMSRVRTRSAATNFAINQLGKHARNTAIGWTLCTHCATVSTKYTAPHRSTSSPGNPKMNNIHKILSHAPWSEVTVGRGGRGVRAGHQRGARRRGGLAVRAQLRVLSESGERLVRRLSPVWQRQRSDRGAAAREHLLAAPGRGCR